MSPLLTFLTILIVWFISLVVIVAGAYFVFPRREK